MKPTDNLVARCAAATALMWLVGSMAAPVAGAEFAFDTQLRVSRMGVDGDPAFKATNADVAYDSIRNRYMVVWQGERTPTEGPQIYGKVVSRLHETILGDFKISDTPGGSATEAPTIAFDPSLDEFLVLWTAKPPGTGGKQIYAQRLAPTTGNRLAAADIAVSHAASEPLYVDAHAPALAYDSATGSQLAVWQADHEQNGKYEIYGRMLSGKVPVLGPVLRISTTAADGPKEADDPAVAYDSVNHRFLVAWSSDDAFDAEREIYARVYDGSQLAPQKRVSHMGPDDDPAIDAFDPSLAFDPSSREYLLAWRGDTAGHNDQFEVYGQRLDADNVEVGETDFPISDMGPDGNPAYAVGGAPSVEYLSVTSRYLVLWHANDDSIAGETEVFGQALGADGREIGTNDFRVTRYGTDGATTMKATSPAAAYNPQANQTLVAWEGTGAAPLALLETEIFSRPVGDDRDGDSVIDGFDLCPTVSGAPVDANADGCADDRDNDAIIDALDGCAGVGGGAFDADRDGCPDDSDGDGVLDGVDRCGAIPGGLHDVDANGCPDDGDGDGVIDALDGCPGVSGGAFDATRDGCADDSDGDGVLDAGDPCPRTGGGRLDVNGNGCPGPFRTLAGVRLSSSLDEYPRYVVVRRLRLRDLPAARVVISLRCVRRCTFKEQLVKSRGPRVIHSRVFKNRRLRPGAVVSVSLTSPDMIGSDRSYRVSRTEIAQIGKARCIPLGSTRARTTCDPGR